MRDDQPRLEENVKGLNNILAMGGSNIRYALQTRVSKWEQQEFTLTNNMETSGETMTGNSLEVMFALCAITTHLHAESEDKVKRNAASLRGL